MSVRAVAVTTVLLLVVVAGCSGVDGDGADRTTLTAAPVPTDGTPDQVLRTETATPTETERTPTRSTTVAELDPYKDNDARTIFRRVTDILQVDAPAPTVERHAGPRIEAGEEPISVPNTVGEVLGVTTRSTAGTPIGRIDRSTVHLVAGGTEVTTREYNLAYLYARTVQESVGWTDSLSTHRNGTLDERLVAASLTRGGAAFTTDQYASIYGVSVNRSARQWDYDWWSSPWLARAAVEAGYERAEGAVSIPSAIRRVYDRPPNSTEQLLHGYSQDTEPVGPLIVSVAGTGEWDRTSDDRFGELATRALLSTRLPTATAAGAARGWGNDRLLTFENGSATGLVWVTTWDRTDDANGFERAIRTYVEQDEPPSHYAIERLDERTVVLVAGSRPFVEWTTVSGDDRSVQVAPPG